MKTMYRVGHRWGVEIIKIEVLHETDHFIIFKHRGHTSGESKEKKNSSWVKHFDTFLQAQLFGLARVQSELERLEAQTNEALENFEYVTTLKPEDLEGVG